MKGGNHEEGSIEADRLFSLCSHDGDDPAGVLRPYVPVEMPVLPDVDLSRELTEYRLEQAAIEVAVAVPELVTVPEPVVEEVPEEEVNPPQIEEMSLTGAPLTSNSACKPWMDYRAVTDTASTQWAIISQAYHRGDGLLEVNGCILVALGSYWGPVGTTYRAVIGGREVYLMKGDAKQDQHTYGGYGYEGLNGHLIEVIVDTDYLAEMAMIMGDCDYVEALNGEVTELEVLG